MPDFSKITEAPEQKATREQLWRIGQRYRFARDHSEGPRILEVACGTGIGLPFLACHAQAYVIGGELDPANAAIARNVTASDSRLALIRLDAQTLPFTSQSLETVICFEALYYFPDAHRFAAETARVLTPDGVLILGTVNRAWQDFHPSPYTHTYFNSVELVQLLQPYFLHIDLYGGFPVQQAGFLSKMLSLLKHAAMTAHLIPGSLKARAYLKRIVFGPMQPIPRQVTDEIVPEERPLPIPVDKMNTTYKIVYTVAIKGNSTVIDLL